MVDYWKPGIEGMRGSCYHFEVLGRRREEEVWRKFDGGNFRLSDCWVAKGFLTMEMYDGEVENLGELVDFVVGEGRVAILKLGLYRLSQKASEIMSSEIEDIGSILRRRSLEDSTFVKNAIAHSKFSEVDLRKLDKELEKIILQEQIDNVNTPGKPEKVNPFNGNMWSNRYGKISSDYPSKILVDAKMYFRDLDVRASEESLVLRDKITSYSRRVSLVHDKILKGKVELLEKVETVEEEVKEKNRIRGKTEEVQRNGGDPSKVTALAKKMMKVERNLEKKINLRESALQNLQELQVELAEITDKKDALCKALEVVLDQKVGEKEMALERLLEM
ncbi:hypothetical protein TrVE_jg4955 [Triparma verrucosa]|uniref:Uncharacterized protein n=1 Tax=Triparma verrucosa TaxID=1606542 RepID=A0A9W7KU49_9STRA|nr:hypothetical protein TrVE_jg4955 [Triparma verrucosa]